jgi:hypothetical protein
VSVLKMLEAMKHSPLHNYAGVPGLTSWMIGTGAKGNVRLMECSREHHEAIIPHSHRFSFVCQVLAGTVMNVLWEPNDEGDEYAVTEMLYDGAPGSYTRASVERGLYRARKDVYTEGDTYSMEADQVHSIFFSRGAKVLFLEGEQTTTCSVILEPVVNGVIVPTFDVKEWMFLKGKS